MRSAIVSALCCLLLVCTAQARETVPRSHLYKIRVEGCKVDPKNRILTGFRLAGQPGIYTALHGVVGYREISAMADSGRGYLDLDIGWVDIDRDIALLVSDELMQSAATGLTAHDDITQYFGDLHVLGYPLNSKKINPTWVKLRTKPIDKFSAFPSELYNFLRERGSPSTNVDALDVAGYILPCDSGAPLADDHDRVLGIALGGLRGGTVAYSYAIPIWQVNLEAVGAANLSRLNELALKELGADLHASSGNSMNDLMVARKVGRSKGNWIWFRSGASLNISGRAKSGFLAGTEIANKKGPRWLHKASFLLECTRKDYGHLREYATLAGLPSRIEPFDETTYIVEFGPRYYVSQRPFFWLYCNALGGISMQRGYDYNGASGSVGVGVTINARQNIQFGIEYRQTASYMKLPDEVTFNPFGEANVDPQEDWRSFGQLVITVGWLAFH
jgi:hypothetical protein